MPQFDPSSFASQLFWLIVTFTALFMIVWRFAIPRIGDVMDQRQKMVDDDLERAAQFKAEAESAIATYEKALAEARAQARAVLKESEASLQETQEARQREVSARLAEEIKNGEARIAKARDEALDSLADIAADTAAAAAEKVAGIRPAPDETRKAVAATLEKRAN
ncbi:F0F1 ATP synthase subunit B' [Roseospirillum parvum]|uniref:ATP synthase subunit b n=1 Tax=Roseospirillum parvum TaxID=83401 RepID=A0A1G7UFD8_9PROT|nr:F0F1 ATP synthase subunit B' [Roseospirillum parvum]SDG46028.1 F-type H+-transporting ATPase subunit b [Roseospirillum parvum]